VPAEGSELLRRMIQGYFDQRGAEEPIHARVLGEDGIIVRTHRGEGGKRNLETRFGEVVITRRGYGRWGVKSVFPLDAKLNLPPDQYSHERQKSLWNRLFADQLEDSDGGQMTKRQAEEVAVHLSQDFDTFYGQARARPQMARDKGTLLVISADGKGIVMHPKGLRAATRRAMEREEHKQHTRLRSGEKKNRKRMATVVSVYEVDPYPRTAKSTLGLEQPPERKRPRPENKRTWAWVEADQGTVIEQACAEAVRRDPDQQMRWVVLTDGQPDLLRQVSARRQALSGRSRGGPGFCPCPRIPLKGRLYAAPRDRRRT